MSHDPQQQQTDFRPLLSRPNGQALANGGVTEKISGVRVKARGGRERSWQRKLAAEWWLSGGGGRGRGVVVVRAVGNG